MFAQLFAEVPAALPPLTWAGAVVAVSTTIGLAVQGYFALLGSRDRVRLDDVEKGLQQCQEHRALCEEKLRARARKARSKPRPRRKK